MVNEPALLARAEIIREKGTNRSQFFRGMVDKYRWVDLGSSYLVSDILAALLAAQLEAFAQVQERRHAVWAAYDEQLSNWTAAHGITTQVVPDECAHPAHLFALLLPTEEDRTAFIAHCAERGITTPFHYVPLHTTEIGTRVGRVAGECPVTDDVSARLVRLPLYAGMTDAHTQRVIETVTAFEPAR